MTQISSSVRQGWVREELNYGTCWRFLNWSKGEFCLTPTGERSFRGNWRASCHPYPQHGEKAVLTWSGEFSRFYFSLEVAKSEVEAWVERQGEWKDNNLAPQLEQHLNEQDDDESDRPFFDDDDDTDDEGWSFYDEEDDDDFELGDRSSSIPTRAEILNEVYTDSSLKKSQVNALANIIEFLYSENRFFRLTGYAGTGKSYVACKLMRLLAKLKHEFVAGSPTNKASKSLYNLAKEQNLSVRVETLARLLGQQPVLNEETGKEEFLSDREKDLKSYDVVLLDEFSMISKSNFTQIQEAIAGGKTKVIFIGDAAQLPPVGESEPCVISYPMDSAELTEVVRYDGAIAHIAEQIRSNPIYNRIVYPFTTTEDKSIVKMPPEPVLVGQIRD